MLLKSSRLSRSFIDTLSLHLCAGRDGYVREREESECERERDRGSGRGTPSILGSNTATKQKLSHNQYESTQLTPNDKVLLFKNIISNKLFLLWCGPQYKQEKSKRNIKHKNVENITTTNCM